MSNSEEPVDALDKFFCDYMDGIQVSSPEWDSMDAAMQCISIKDAKANRLALALIVAVAILEGVDTSAAKNWLSNYSELIKEVIEDE